VDSLLHTIIAVVGNYGFAGIFVLMVLENLGFPLPTEVGFIVGQSLVISGRSNYLEIFILVLIAQTLGSIISYLLGKYFAGSIHHIKKPSSSLKNAQDVFAKWMKKYGAAAVFVSRLVGYVRPWASYLAGVGEIKFVPFIIYNIIGSAIIVAISMLTLGGATEIYMRYPVFRPIAIGLFLLFFFGFWIALFIYRKVKSQKKSIKA
jgi:membrane protein DedA with SNARE-associated domain